MLAKIYIFIIIISFMTITIAGCQTASNDLHEEADLIDPDSSQDEGEYQQADNHAGNLINDGFLTKKDDWLYYSNFNDGGKIYKAHADGGEHIKVNNEQSSKMTIIGDWIYYLGGDWIHYLGRGGNVYKIRTDGSERTLLFDDHSWELLVLDDWIYHTSSSYGIFKLQTNGSGHKVISGDPASYFHLVDGWLYYCDGHMFPDGVSGPIKKVSTDGGESITVVDKWVATFNIVDDWIYYSGYDSSNNTHAIFKSRTDGSDNTIVSDDRSFELNVVGGWIYFINENDDRSIYKIRTDGSKRMKLNDDESGNIIVVGDWIYYKNIQRDEDYRIISEDIYQLRPDGSGLAKFEMAEPEIREADREDYYVAVDEGKHLFIRHSYGTKDKSSDDIMERLPRGRLLKIIDDHDNIIVADDYTWWEAIDPQTGLSGWLAAEYLRRELPDHNDESKDYEEERIFHPEHDRRGNTVGNIINSGIVAKHDDWIFYALADADEEGYLTDTGIYKIRTNSSGRTQIYNRYGFDGGINVVGDWLYFTLPYDSQGDVSPLYKIRTDGSELTKISDDDTAEITVINDWIYYLSYRWVEKKQGRYNSIYKIRTDGSDRTQLNPNHSLYLNVVEDWIYFSNGDDGYNIYKMRTDGSELNKINSDYSKYINVVGDWIYYCNGSDGFVIYKIRTDGSERTKVSDDVVGTLNVYNNWIYYSNLNDNLTIYKIHTDGTGRIQLNNEHSARLNIADDWIYYCSKGDITDLYKIRTNGSDRQRVN